MKGVGFFLGGLLLQTLGFRGSLWTMARTARDWCCWAWCSVLPPMMGRKQGLEIGEGTVRQESRHQRAGGGARFPVRRA
jgi:hypothetical protein